MLFNACSEKGFFFWFLVPTIFLLSTLVQRQDAADLASLMTSGSTYQIEVTAAAMEFKNPEYVAETGYMRVFRKSKDAPRAVHGFFPVLKQLPVDLNSTFIAYQKLSNKWVESFMKGTTNVCGTLEAKTRFYRFFYDNSNFPHKCPVQKANYTLTLDSFDKAELPPGIPKNEWKIKFRWHYKEETLMIATFELKVDQRKTPRKKKDHH